MNKILSKILVTIISLSMLIFIGFQVFRYLCMPRRTETAYLFTQSDFIATKGVAVRDETVISTDKSGVKSYLYDDGDRVSFNMPIAEIYNSEQDAANEAMIKKLQQEIDMLTQSSDPGRSDFANADVLNSQISEKLGHISDAVTARNLGALDTYKNEYVKLLNTRQIATDRAENFDLRITQLMQQVESLKSSTQPGIAAVTAPKPGYFVSVIDGYEDKLNYDMLESMSMASFEQLLEQQGGYPSQEGVVGKIITNFEWYFAALVPNENLGRFSEGVTVTLTFPYVSGMAYTAVLDKTISPENEENSIAVFKMNRMNKELSTIRNEQAEISFKSYKGIKVRNSVIRFQGSQAGVYVKNGDNADFKKLDVLFHGDGFVLSRQHDESGYLQLYDEVIIQGKELSTIITQ